jgi:hypothetical protein
MPFRFATALVAVEREGIIDTQVVQLNGQDPTVSLKVQPDWGPNVYVSVLALRGRLREVPWYSFFTWGFKAPREWWTAFWYEGKEYQAPSALVDLSKPAFRLGLAEIRVGTKAHQMDVKVTADKESYPVRGKATGHHQRHAAQRQARRQRRSGSGRRGPGPAGADAQHQLEPARSHAAASQLGRGNLHRADGNHWPAPLRPQGGAGRRRRRPQPPRASCSTPCCCGTPGCSWTPTARPR